MERRTSVLVSGSDLGRTETAQLVTLNHLIRLIRVNYLSVLFAHPTACILGFPPYLCIWMDE